MAFHAYPPKPWKDILPLASEEARDLVTGLVVYQSTSRFNAQEVIALPLREKCLGKTLLTVQREQALNHVFFSEGPASYSESASGWKCVSLTDLHRS